MEITKQETTLYRKVELIKVKIDDKRTAEIEKWNGYDQFDYDFGYEVLNKEELKLSEEEEIELDELLTSN